MEMDDSVITDAVSTRDRLVMSFVAPWGRGADRGGSHPLCLGVLVTSWIGSRASEVAAGTLGVDWSPSRSRADSVKQEELGGFGGQSSE